MTYFNTNTERGATLAESHKRAQRQEAEVLRIFRNCRPNFLAAHEVHARLGSDILLTSVRRAITSLTSEGKLVKQRFMVPGPYGKKVYVWGLPVRKPRQLELW